MGRSTMVVTPQNPKKTNNKARRRKARQRGINSSSALRPHLSPCALNYAKAVLNPFAPPPGEVCIPDNVDIPSFKFRSFVRGAFFTGTAGFGSVSVAPHTNSNTSTFATWTNTAYSANSIPASGAAATGDMTNYRFPFATSTLSIRVVACAVRVRYGGTLLNRGGSYIGVSDAAKSSGTLVGRSSSDLRGDTNSHLEPVGEGWFTARYTPAVASLTDFSSDDANGTVNDNVRLVIAVNAPAAGVPYEFEISTFYEAVPNGNNSPPTVSVSHSDPVGLGIVKSFLNTLGATEAGTKFYNNFLTYASSKIATAGASYFAPGTQLLLEL